MSLRGPPCALGVSGISLETCATNREQNRDPDAIGTKLDHLRHGRRNGSGSHEGRERKRKGRKMRKSIKKENGDNDEVINK